MAAAAHRRWTSIEIAALEQMQAAKVAKPQIAAALGRTEASVQARIDVRRKSESARRLLGAGRGRIHDCKETSEPPPPPFVIRERAIRGLIDPVSYSAKVFGDPLPGYSGKDNKQRHLSVQDALEICALYNGRQGEMVALAASYGVEFGVIKRIIDGSWFNQLLPSNLRFKETV